MDLAAFRASLSAAKPPRLEPGPARAVARRARATGTARMTPRRPTRAARATGCTPICIARRATPATPPIGTAARASRSAEPHSTPAIVRGVPESRTPSRGDLKLAKLRSSGRAAASSDVLGAERKTRDM